MRLFTNAKKATVSVLYWCTNFLSSISNLEFLEQRFFPKGEKLLFLHVQIINQAAPNSFNSSASTSIDFKSFTTRTSEQFACKIQCPNISDFLTGIFWRVVWQLRQLEVSKRGKSGGTAVDELSRPRLWKMWGNDRWVFVQAFLFLVFVWKNRDALYFWHFR